MKTRLATLYLVLSPFAFGDPQVSLTAPNRTYPAFILGDSFSLTITNAEPNSLVEIYAEQYPPEGGTTYYGTTPFGNTDEDGFKEINGTFDSWTIGSWMEIVYVDGNEAGTIQFTITEPQNQTCEASSTGPTTFYSSDIYGQNFGWQVTIIPGETTIYHNITAGPCEFTDGTAGGGIWITGEYADFGNTERTWILKDTASAGAQQAPTCPAYIPRCADVVNVTVPYYPVLDYATITSTVVNQQSMEVTMLNTYVTLWIVGYI